MRTLLLWIGVVVVALVATGCGTRMTAVTSRPTTPVRPRQLTVADDGVTVRLARGQSVTATLAAEGMFSWHIPAATGPAVRQVDSGGGYPTDQPAQATFLATEPGTATLAATNDTPCLHVHPACLPPQRQWQVTLLVG